MKRITKILITIIFIFSIFFVGSTVYAASDFTIKTLDFDAVLNEDGSMDVTETWDVTIYSETNTLYKEYDIKKGEYQITNITVTDVTNNREFNQITTLMHHVTTNCYYAMNNTNGLFEIAWGVNKSSGNITYEVTYTVENAITKYNDCSELYWQFIGKNFSASIDKVTGRITLPSNVSNMDNLRVWAHGPLNGEINREDSKTVTFVVDPYYSGRYVEIRLAIIEPAMFSLATNISHKDNFDNILAEESEWADQANREREAKKREEQIMIFIISAISAAIAGLFIFGILRNNKKSKEVQKIEPSIKLDYYRDIPNEKEATPTEAAFLYYYDKSGMSSNIPKVISATILDLALKKYIEFEIRNNSKGKEEVYIKIMQDKDGTELKESEKVVYELLKTISKNDPNGFSMKDFEKYAKAHNTTFLSKIEKISKETEKEQIANKNYDKEKEKIKNTYMAKIYLPLIFFVIYGFISLVLLFDSLSISPIIPVIITAVAFITGIIYSVSNYKMSKIYSGLTQVRNG